MRCSPESSRERPVGLPGHRDLCDVFVKVGGSILDHDDLTTTLVPAITDLASQYRIVVLTGGGQAAKRVKSNQMKNGGDFYRFWRATGLFPEVNAHLLASYSTAFAIVACAAEISACWETGRVAVFAPAGAILHSLFFLPDWLVTTDSMGLYFAKQSGARRYVIVSDVDGIYDRRMGGGDHGAPICRLDVEELARLPSSKVDHGFAEYFRRFPLHTVIVNGAHPERVSAAIRGIPTRGTEIVADPR